MGPRVRAVAVVAVVLAVGAFLGSAVSQWRQPPRAAEPGPEGDAAMTTAPAGVRVRVEVLNGGGLRGMAREATEHLRERDFDVVFYGNARTFDHDSSVVLDRVDRPDLARAVAEAMGITRVRVEPDSNLFVDVSVVLGADWQPPPDPADSVRGDAPMPAWWDVRRFFRRDSSPEPMPRGRMADPGEEGSGE